MLLLLRRGCILSGWRLLLHLLAHLLELHLLLLLYVVVGSVVKSIYSCVCTTGCSSVAVLNSFAFVNCLRTRIGLSCKWTWISRHTWSISLLLLWFFECTIDVLIEYNIIRIILYVAVCYGGAPLPCTVIVTSVVVAHAGVLIMIIILNKNGWLFFLLLVADGFVEHVVSWIICCSNSCLFTWLNRNLIRLFAYSQTFVNN